MLRRRGFAWMAALTLVLSLSVAPVVQAAGAPAGPVSLWTSMQDWVQDLLVDWLGWGGDQKSASHGSTYDEPESTEEIVPTSPSPLDVGTGTTSTTDEGPDPDPNG